MKNSASGPRQDGRLIELDGLRALLVLAVLLHHLDERWMPGGFLGVDAFFVISGFVITRLIREELQTKHWDLRSFWQRRALRLLPSLLITLALTWAAAWWLLFPAELNRLASNSLSSLGALCNLQFARGGDYFARELNPSALRHLWSLAVEAQFYLVAAFLLPRWSWLRKSWVMALACLSMLGVAVFETHHFPNLAFYSLESRAWELLAGAWVACRTSVLGPQQARFLSHLGLFFLLACLAGIGVQPEGLQPASLAVVSAAAMLTTSAHKTPPGWLRRILSSSLMLRLGGASYAIYLLHWPIIVLAQTLLPGWTTSGKLAAAALSLLLGLLLDALIEKPARALWQRKPWSRPLLRWTSIGALLTISGLASVTRWREGWMGSPGAKALLSKVPEARDPKPPVAQWINLGAAATEPSLLILGDSHAQCLLPSIEVALRTKGIRAKAWCAPSTVPLLGCRSSKHSDWLDREAMPEGLASSASTVLLIASWSWYLKGEEQLQDLSGNNAADPPALLGSALERSLSQWRKAGKKVILMRPWPVMPQSVPQWMQRHERWKIPLPPSLTDAAAHEERHRLANALLSHAAQTQQAEVLDPTEALTSARGRLMYESGGKPLYQDSSHLSRLGADRVATWLATKLTPEKQTKPH